MPRLLVTASDHDRERSLGWLAISWLEFFAVHGPGDVQGQPVEHGDEYSAFIADCYAVGESGRRLYDSAFLSRPKGCDKSGLGARLVLFEGLGPCRILRADPADPTSPPQFAEGGEVYRDPWGLGFEYEYAPGEPMGRPVQSPFIRCMATEEEQTGNVYDSVYYNLAHGPLAFALDRKDDAGLSRILLPGGGEITPSTASSASKDGGKETFVDFDETHLYNRPELRRMYATVGRNLRKRKRLAETWFLETTTMFQAGEDSVAEDTYKYAESLRSGKSRNQRERLLLDHRWGQIDPDELGDMAKLAAAVEEAFGDAMAWNDLPGILDGFTDERNDPEEQIRYFLNASSGTRDAFVLPSMWANRVDATKVIAERDFITLGFDGSRGRHRGKPDATSLIGCRVEDGHIFELGVWEAGNRQEDWSDWSPPIVEIEAVLDRAFSTYDVAAFYADPAKDWRSHVNAWEAKYGDRVQVRSKQAHPFEWWMTTGRSGMVQQAIEQLDGAIRNRDMTHSGEADLTRHVLNARRRFRNGKLRLEKESDYSPRKIDAAIGAVLAWQARLDAIAAGAKPQSDRASTVFGRFY